MAPGRYDPPPIYRGCTWGPITLIWKGSDGNPSDLTGWTPYSEMSNGANLIPIITDGLHGVTIIGMNKDQTAGLKLGTFKYDWIWWNLAPLGIKYPPSIYGEILVLDPKTHEFFAPPPSPQ